MGQIWGKKESLYSTKKKKKTVLVYLSLTGVITHSRFCNSFYNMSAQCKWILNVHKSYSLATPKQCLFLTSAKMNLMPVQEVMRGTRDPSLASTDRGSLNSPTVKLTASCTSHRQRATFIAHHTTNSTRLSYNPQKTCHIYCPPCY